MYSSINHMVLHMYIGITDCITLSLSCIAAYMICHAILCVQARLIFICENITYIKLNIAQFVLFMNYFLAFISEHILLFVHVWKSTRLLFLILVFLIIVLILFGEGRRGFPYKENHLHVLIVHLPILRNFVYVLSYIGLMQKLQTHTSGWARHERSVLGALT